MTHSDLVAFCEIERPRLVGLLGLYCGDAEVAQELAHDAIAKACESWPKVRKMDSPEAWIYRVALNLAKSYFRRKAAERRARAKLQLTAEVTEDPPSEYVVAIRRAVASLPFRQRTAIVLRYYLDLSVAESARLMDCSEGTVKALTHKGVAALRRQQGLVELKETADAT